MSITRGAAKNSWGTFRAEKQVKQYWQLPTHRWPPTYGADGLHPILAMAFIGSDPMVHASVR